MSKKELRPYQKEAINAVLGDWAHGVKRALISLAMGTGKTHIICKLLEQVWQPGNRAVFIVHQDSLMHQAYATFETEFSHQVSLGKVQGTKYEDYDAYIIFAMVQSLNETRLKKIGKVDYLFLDEVHHYQGENAWSQTPLWFFEQNPDTLALGVTATHNRADGISLGKMFPEIAERNQLTYYYGILQAIRDGWLCPFDAYVVETQLDISGFRSKNGFLGTEEQWNRLWEAGNWAELLYDEWQEYGGPNRQTMAFMPSVRISKEFARWLGQEHGIITGHVDGNQSLIYNPNSMTMDSIERNDLVRMFRANKFPFLSNFGVFAEGTDFPEMETLIIARPTESPTLYQQIFGRVLRWDKTKQPNKRAAILHCNFEGHLLADYKGLAGTVPTQEVEEVEQAIEKLTGGDTQQGPICPNCHNGYLTRLRGTENYICEYCQAMTCLPGELTGEPLFDPAKLNGVSSQARLIDLIQKQEVAWYLNEGIFSVGLGVGSAPLDKEFLRVKADRTFLIVPPERIPARPGGYSLVQVYRPVTETKMVGSRFNQHPRHTFGPMAGTILFTHEDKQKVFERADKLVELLKDPLISDKDKQWRLKPVSEGQTAMLQKFEVEVSPKMNRGEASRVLAHHFALSYLRRKGVID